MPQVSGNTSVVQCVRSAMNQDDDSKDWYQISNHNGRLYASVCQSCPSDYQCLTCSRYYLADQCQYKEYKQRITCLNNCMIPARYTKATVDSLKQTGDDSKTTPTIKRAVQWLLRWCRAETIPSQGILLSSGPGTGKSFALAAVLRYLTLERTQSCLFMEFDHFLMELKQCYHNKKNEYTLYENIRNVSVLVIDDLGSHRDSPWASDVMQRIIGYRYNDVKPVLISTNLQLTQMKQIIPLNTFSRLKEICYWLSFDGPDRRIHSIV